MQNVRSVKLKTKSAKLQRKRKKTGVLSFKLLFFAFSFTFFAFLLPKEAFASLIVKAPPYIGLQEGLVGHWSFDGPDMITQSDGDQKALDRSGNNNTGTLTNGPKRAAGKIGQALEFDAFASNDQSVVVSDNATISGLSAVSVSVWFKMSSFPGLNDFQFVVSKSNLSDNREYRFRLEDSSGGNGLVWIISNDGNDPGTAKTVHGISNFSLNTWYHAVGTYDDNNNDLLHLYINGVLVDTETGESGGTFDGTGNLFFGSDGINASTGDEFDGQIDEVRVYNRALSPDEIKRLYKIGSTFVVNKTRQDTLREGLVGHWSFDGPDMSQSTNNVWAFDRSGQGNNGVLKNMATSTARKAGKIGQALDFDGVDDYADIGTFDVSGSGITIAAWVKADAFPPAIDTRFISKANSITTSGTWWMLGQTNSGGDKLRFRLKAGGSTQTLIASSGDLPINTWFHAIATYDGSTMRLYKDGIEVGSVAKSGTINTDVISVNIGRNPDGSNHMDGAIDEVRIYNRALSPDEIKRLYKIGSTFVVNKTRQDTLREGLVGHWSFDGPDMSQSTNNIWALDRSGQGNNGVLTNTATSTVRKAGKIGQALDFDGVNDHIYVSHESRTYDAISTSAWIKLDKVTGSQGIVFDFQDNRFTVEGDELQWRHGGGFAIHLTTGVDFVIGRWYHVAATFDENSDRVKIYVDGVEKYTGIDIGDITTFVFEHYIGSTSATEGFLDGLIDEVRVYNRALSPDEIKRLYKIGSTFVVNKTRQDTLREGLVGHWSFDGPDMSQSTNNVWALDRSGNNNNGVLKNMATSTARKAGKIGQALEFDGSNDYVDAGDSSSINQLTSFTYSVWVYPKGWGEGEEGNVVTQAFSGTPAKQLRLRNDAAPLQSLRAFVSCFACTNASTISAAGTMTLNSWQHVVMTFDDNGDRKIRLYRNGVEMTYDTQTAATASPLNTLGQDKVWIGDVNDATPSDGSFDGQIDEVRVYNRALSPDEIKRLYNMGR